MAACWGTWTGRRVLSVATGAGAVYLLYRTVAEALSSVPGGTDRYRLESPDHQDGLPVEEVLSRRVCEELLEMLRAQQDGRSRSAILRSITRCVYLMDTKNPTCSPEHIQLVASCLDDHNGDTKVQALNTLRAFATRSLFTARVQDFYPKILDLVISSRDTEVQVAALRLLNALPVPPNIEPLLRRAVPNLLGFLQWDNYAIQLQVLRLLIALSRKEELLPDILNCQVRPEFLSLMNNSQPGKLLPLRGPFRRELPPGRTPPGHVRPPRGESAAPGVQTHHEPVVVQAGCGDRRRRPGQARRGQRRLAPRLALWRIHFLGDAHGLCARRRK
uniref:Armadillo repeat-containing domain-containing protein n=1 Tax=Anser cygnoides TaxID=8845 RepID=A0A8B9DE82_ANSCY